MIFHLLRGLPTRQITDASSSPHPQARNTSATLVHCFMFTLLASWLMATPSPAVAGGASGPPSGQTLTRAHGSACQRILGFHRDRSTTRSGLTNGRTAPGETQCTTCEPLREFKPRRFSHPTRIDNPWMPLEPGTQWVYQARANLDGAELDHHVIFTVTDVVKEIGGVTSVVVWIQDLKEGELSEAVLAFFAQDDRGDLWFLGEYAEEYELGEFLTAEATWIHGIDDSHAGVQIQEDPAFGRSYQLANSPSTELLDCVSPIERRHGSRTKVCVPAGCFKNLIMIREWAPLDQCPEILTRFYAKDVGIIQSGAPDDLEGESLVLVRVRELSRRQMREARAAVLALDAHGPEVSEVYAATEAARPARADHRSDDRSAKLVEAEVARPATFLNIGTNPVRVSTSISFGMAKAGPVELGIYDLAGRQVRSLVSRSEEAGVHQVQWDGRDDAGHGVARGVYFARLRLGPETLHRTLVLIQ